VPEDCNVEIARELWLATARGDLRALRALLSESVVWTIRASGDFSGEHRGRDAVVAVMVDVGESADDVRMTIVDVFSNDGGFVVWYRVEAERADAELDVDIMMVGEVERGQVTRLETVPVDAERTDRFWTSIGSDRVSLSPAK
jgi:hypothetical protein